MERQTYKLQQLSQVLKRKNPPKMNRRLQQQIKKIKEVSNKMARLKLKTLREMNDQDLSDKLAELKTDLGKLQLEKSKGTLKKQSGSIRWLRRDIARMKTIMNERKAQK
jgi:large subunit ribosomal protein L29